MVHHRLRDAHPAGARLNPPNSLKQITALVRSPPTPERPEFHVETADPAEKPCANRKVVFKDILPDGLGDQILVRHPAVLFCANG
jgi:hypothetical protein